MLQYLQLNILLILLFNTFFKNSFCTEIKKKYLQLLINFSLENEIIGKIIGILKYFLTPTFKYESDTVILKR